MVLRGSFALLTVGVVGYALSGLLFSLILPLVWWAIKLILFLMIGYLILRVIKPKMAEDLKERMRC